MITIEINEDINISDAVRIVNAKANDCKERVVADFDGFIIDSYRSEHENMKAFTDYSNGNIDWKKRRYEVAKDILLLGISNDMNRIVCVGSPNIEDIDKQEKIHRQKMVNAAFEYADIFIRKAKLYQNE